MEGWGYERARHGKAVRQCAEQPTRERQGALLNAAQGRAQADAGAPRGRSHVVARQRETRKAGWLRRQLSRQSKQPELGQAPATSNHQPDLLSDKQLVIMPGLAGE